MLILGYYFQKMWPYLSIDEVNLCFLIFIENFEIVSAANSEENLFFEEKVKFPKEFDALELGQRLSR
jgi:hypothetical protein